MDSQSVFSLLEHSSQVFVPTSSNTPIFDITAHSPSPRISPCVRMIDQVFTESIHHTDSHLLEGSALEIVHRPPFFFKNPLSNALEALNTGCPLSLKLATMTSAVSFHCPSGLYLCVPYFFLLLLDREKTNVPTEIFLRNPSPFQSSKSIHDSVPSWSSR